MGKQESERKHIKRSFWPLRSNLFGLIWPTHRNHQLFFSHNLKSLYSALEKLGCFPPMESWLHNHSTCGNFNRSIWNAGKPCSASGVSTLSQRFPLSQRAASLQHFFINSFFPDFQSFYFTSLFLLLQCIWFAPWVQPGLPQSDRAGLSFLGGTFDIDFFFFFFHTKWHRGCIRLLLWPTTITYIVFNGRYFIYKG